MIVPDYRNFQYSNELYHYGIKGRSGRYPLGSGERPYQDYPDKAVARIRKKEGKILRKYDRYDKKTYKQQQTANKVFQKAVKKSNSKFATKKSIGKAYDKAGRAQEKANRFQYKGAQKYKKYEKKINKLNVEMNDEIKQRGLKYMDQVVMNSKSAYQVALMRRVG